MKPLDRWDSLFAFYGQLRNVAPSLLKAQVIAESGGNPFAISRVGAKGLAQFMEATWNEWAPRVINAPNAPLPPWATPVNTEVCIAVQAAMMQWLLDRYAGDVPSALAAYNWGPGHVDAVREHYPASWRTMLPQETHNYIGRIMKIRVEFLQMDPDAGPVLASPKEGSA